MIGFQAKAQISDGASNAFTDIPELVTVTLPEDDVGEVDRTPLNQTARYKQFRPTLLDGGTLKLEIFWSSAEYARIRTHVLSGTTTKQVKIIGPDVDGVGAGTPENFVFDGFFKKLSPGSYEKEGERMFSVEFRVNGVTFTPAGAPNP